MSLNSLAANQKAFHFYYYYFFLLKQKVLEGDFSAPNKYAQSRNMQDISTPKTRDSVLAKCRGLTGKISRLDEELKSVVDSVNSLDYSSSPNDNLTKDTLLILHNYYEAIRDIEVSEVPKFECSLKMRRSFLGNSWLFGKKLMSTGPKTTTVTKN